MKFSFKRSQFQFEDIRGSRFFNFILIIESCFENFENINAVESRQLHLKFHLENILRPSHEYHMDNEEEMEFE